MKILKERTVILKMHGSIQRKNLGLLRWTLLTQIVNLLNLGIFVCSKVQGYAQSKVFFFIYNNNSNYYFYSQCHMFGTNKLIEQLRKGTAPRRKSSSNIISISICRQLQQQYHQLLLPEPQPQNKALQQSVQVRCCNNIINDNIIMFLNKKLNYIYKFFHRSFFKVFFKYLLFSRLSRLFQQVSRPYFIILLFYILLLKRKRELSR